MVRESLFEVRPYVLICNGASGRLMDIRLLQWVVVVRQQNQTPEESLRVRGKRIFTRARVRTLFILLSLLEILLPTILDWTDNVFQTRIGDVIRGIHVQLENKDTSRMS